MSNEPDRNTYHIDFDTKEMPGRIVAVRIRIDREFIIDDQKKFAVNLSDHPLYPRLAAYVKANPPRK